MKKKDEDHQAYNDCFFKQVALKSGDRVLDEA